jgi:drug/metabolite transporter (DMT)-like permease
MIGIFWSLLMAAFFGFSQLSSRKGLTEIAVDQGTFIMIVISTLLMAIPFFWLDGLTLIQQADRLGLVYFIAAGLVHFIGGFTLLNLSISTIGAARTSSLIATTPLFATFLAALTLNELINVWLIVGVVVVVAGVRFITSARMPGNSPERSTAGEVGRVGFIANNPDILKLAGASTFGLLAAFSWGITPVLIKKGLESLPSPVVGVTLSMTCAGLVYAVVLGLRGRLRPIFTNLSQPGGLWQIVAGATVGLGTLCRWTALSFTTAAMVTTLSRASLLITVGLGGKLLGRELEPVTSNVRWGAILIVTGSIIVVLFGRP